MQEELIELFEFLPKSTELYGYVGDDPIYSNETMISTTMDWIRKSSMTKPIASKIEEGFASRRIMIGYTEPGLFNFILKRVKTKMRDYGIFYDSDTFITGDEDTFGMYNSSTNTLAIILDPTKVDILGRTLTKVPIILVHELCHMAANSSTQNYLSIMRDLLVDFYMSWSKKVLEFHDVQYDTKKLNVANVRKLVDDLTITFESPNSNSTTTAKGAEIWFNFFKIFTQDEEVLNKCVKTVGVPFFYFIMDMKSMDSKDNAISYMKLIARSYLDMGVSGILKLTTPCQEFLFTSEVVCVFNQYKITPEAIKLIKNINMG